MLLRCSVVLMLAALFAPHAVSEDFAASPKFEGRAIPEAPQQHKEWTPPPTALPGALVGATTALFECGLADPRGCAYRAIKIVTGDAWSGDRGVLETKGWVLPATESDKQRFAVAWNGLVYPVVELGGPADLRASVQAMLEADKAERAEREEFYRFRHAWEESKSASDTSCLPLKACLLLRLGEEELADETWEAWIKGMRRNTNDDAHHLDDPFLMLARDWLWALFDRAVCAHMRGDDHLARLSAESVLSKWERTKKAARERGWKDGYLAFLEPARVLLEDQKARRERAGRQQVDDDPLEKLIRELEDMRVMQMGQPGRVNLAASETVEALVALGEPAVERLIDVIEKDDRLTRSVQFQRDFMHGRQLLPVSYAAYRALVLILGTSEFPDVEGTEGKPSRVAFAMRVRAYWKINKGLSLPERWFATLKDDKARPSQWLQAAERIVEPTTVRVVSGTRFGNHQIERRGLEPGEKPGIKGEPLRAMKDPSVADLMAKRVRDIAAWNVEEAHRPYVVRDAAIMCIYLCEWDPSGHEKDLLAQIQRCFDILPQVARMDFPQRWNLQRIADHGARIMTSLMAAGESTALARYCECLRKVEPGHVDEAGAQLMRALRPFGGEQVVRETAGALFADEDSPWREWDQFSRIAAVDLYALPSYRALAVSFLADKTPVDEEEPDGDRRCDRIADAVRAAREDAPEFDRSWPLQKRDAAVGATVDYLKGIGAPKAGGLSAPD